MVDWHGANAHARRFASSPPFRSFGQLRERPHLVIHRAFASSSYRRISRKWEHRGGAGHQKAAGSPAAYLGRAGLYLSSQKGRKSRQATAWHPTMLPLPIHRAIGQSHGQPLALPQVSKGESRKHIAGVSSNELYRSLLAIEYKTLLIRSPVPTCLKCARQLCSPRFGQCRLWPHRRPPAC